MGWNTNIYTKINFNGGCLKYKARIIILDTILSGTAFSTKESGTNYDFNGEVINLGNYSSEFLFNNNIRILLNGVELDKNTETTWISNTFFSLSLDVDKDDIITIYG